MDTPVECLPTQPAVTEEIGDASSAKMPRSPNTSLPSPASNLDMNPAESPVHIQLPCIPIARSFERKTPSIERFLDSRRECFWPIGISTISNVPFARDSGIKGGLPSALKSTLAYFSHSSTEYILAVVHKIRTWSLRTINAMPFGLGTHGRLMPQIAKILFGTKDTAASVPTDVLKVVPLPLYPIRVFYGKPPPFSLATQKRRMRWRYRWRFGLAPEIIQEPKVQHIQETVRQYIDFIAPETETISVELLAQGAFNRAYNITAENKTTGFRREYVFRVALPIYPYYKLESDVATTEFIRHTTTVPVPIIYAFDSCPSNELGFEWMLMEKVKGISLYYTWDTMAYSTKKVIAKTVADWVNQISRHKFDKICSLYSRQRAGQMEFYMGPTLHNRLYEGDRLLYDIPRGPFESIQSYFDALLESTERHMSDPKHSARHELEAAIDDGASQGSDESFDGSEQGEGRSEEDILFQADDTDRRNERRYGLTKGDLDILPDELRTYRYLLPKLCPLLSPPGSMSTMLMHPDLSTPNIFVNESGTPVALIDWERARIEPTPLFNAVPHFLTDGSVHQPDFFYIPPGSAVSTGRKTNKLFLYSEEDLAQMRGQSEDNYTRVMERIQLTHLRTIYREELMRLQSPICKAFEKDAGSLEQQLISRVFWPEDIDEHNWASDWAVEHLGESILAELDGEHTSEDQEEGAEGGEPHERENIVDNTSANSADT